MAKVTSEPVRDLIGVNETDYGTRYREDLMEQYKLYVKMADSVSHRRHAANAYFLSVGTAVVGLLAVVHKDIGALWSIAVCVAGVILSITWLAVLDSYRNLNSAKFEVIHEIETRLPLKPYDAEWSNVGRGADKKKYRPLSHVEVVVPWVFVGLFVFLAIVEWAR